MKNNKSIFLSQNTSNKKYSDEELITIEYINPRIIKKLLKHDTIDSSAINKAFIWNTTPQGHNYWRQLYKNPGEPLPIEAQEFLIELLEHYNARNT